MNDAIRLSLADAETFCIRALRGAGASEALASSLARATVDAEAERNSAVGFAHLTDYLLALVEGRIDGEAEPEISQPAPAIIVSDARGGIAQLGFDRAYDRLVAAARQCGVAVFSQRNSYTAGALGFFARRLADEGLVGIACANGPALITVPGAKTPVYCTNPLAFAAPVAGGPPLLIDQSSSATAFVKVREAARTGAPIPEGWAVDAEGRPTTDASEAMKGALLSFGGGRGANIAMMVDVLSAGLSGANWSLDAAPIDRGTVTPGAGLFVLAIDPALFGADLAERMQAQVARLAGFGVHIPGAAKATAREKAARDGLTIPAALHATIAGYAKR